MVPVDTALPRQPGIGGSSLLFIDGRRQIRSVSERHILVPFVRERARHDLARVCAMLAARRHDRAYIQALSQALMHCFGTAPTALGYPRGLIDAGERAIANGQIRVSSALPDRVTVTFDSARPSEPYRFDEVGFAGPAIALRFLFVILQTPDNQAAFTAALGHAAGVRYLNTAPSEDIAGQAPRLQGAMMAMARRAAALLAGPYLALPHLALLPHDPSRQRLRLAWLERRVPAGVGAEASPPPPRLRAASPPARAASPPPASQLPDPPATQSPQAAALVAAAKDGVPFCEECARLAALETQNA